MNWVFISLILATIGQTAVCGFGFTMFISYLGRLLFLLRCVGSVIPFRVSIGFEAAHLFFLALSLVFSKVQINWPNVLFTVLFTLLACLLYVIDDQFYLYVVADDPDKKEEL